MWDINVIIYYKVTVYIPCQKAKTNAKAFALSFNNTVTELQAI